MQMRSEPDNQNSVISFVISKWLLPELSIPAADQKDRGLWGRECVTSEITNVITRVLTNCAFMIVEFRNQRIKLSFVILIRALM